MKTDNELNLIKSLIDNTYNRFGNQLVVNTSKKFNPDNPEFGYCYKYSNEEKHLSIYKIVCSTTGDAFLDKRVMMHEYGHIYLLHLDGIHEELDNKIFKVIKEDREALIQQINTDCGIDFADKLLTRIIDDPVLNHSLHNIAMDMEVNSKILSLDDIEEMGVRAAALFPSIEEQILKKLGPAAAKNPEVMKKVRESVKKMDNESKIKFIHPSRYHFPDGTPFEDGLTYAEYLLLIIKNLPEFIKMLVSIKDGGNGDTSNVTKEQIQQALGGMEADEDDQGNNGQQGQGSGQGSGNGSSQGQGQGQGSGQGQSGGSDSQSQGGSGNGGRMDYSRSMENFDNLLQEMGMADGQDQGQDSQQDGQQGQGQGQGQTGDPSDSQSGNGNGSNGQGSEPIDYPYKGIREGGAADELSGDGKIPGGSHRDHGTHERDIADKKRELGQITGGGGVGCGNGGGPGGVRTVNTMADEVDMALDEVFQNYSSKIVDIATKKDMMYLWNRGINRSVIAPAYRRKYTVRTNPTITFLIDISGSMDTRLVDRILKTISIKMKRVGRGLKYNIISWSTRLGEHIQNIDPRKPVPKISCGGGTEMAGGMKFFKEHYGPESILILISDFEDYMEEWHRVEETMDGYDIYGFNYGRPQKVNFKWKNFKVREFTKHRNGY